MKWLISGWTCQFKWDAAKYPSRLALPQLLGVVNRTLSEVDAATKKKSAHYNQIRNSLAQYEKRSTASLVTRPLTDVIKVHLNWKFSLGYGQEYKVNLGTGQIGWRKFQNGRRDMKFFSRVIFIVDFESEFSVVENLLV